MALKRCKECGKEVSSKAEKCPECGNPIKAKPYGCFKIGCAALLVLFIISIISSISDTTKALKKGSSVTSNKSTPKKATKAAFKENETVNIGYTSYKVLKSWYTRSLSSNQFLHKAPDATFLCVKLIIRNDDKKARTVPPFHLVDENGAEYDTTSKSFAIEGVLGVLETLNPNVQKDGVIVFDVPKGREYKLKLSGGYWSGKDAFVILNPGTK